MVYLLDTDTIIFLIRSLKQKESTSKHKKAERLLLRIKGKLRGGHSVGVSAITKAELEYGAAKGENPAKERLAVHKILAPFDEFAFDADLCAREYGRVRVALERLGSPIGAMDLLIAAHAVALGATLVSNNTRHFGRVEALPVENWLS
jgi:tRNA(fMet)-specific endonuclease VapC